MIYSLSPDYFVRALNESDLDGPYPSWFEDQIVTKYSSHGKFAFDIQHYREFVQSIDKREQLVWAICHRVDGHIGNIALQAISAINRHAELAILLGDSRHWGAGVGKAAGTAILKHGFTKLNLERVFCGTASTNSAMMRLAASLGMKGEGCRRGHLWLEGAWVDVIEYGILRSEWQLSQTADDSNC